MDNVGSFRELFQKGQITRATTETGEEGMKIMVSYTGYDTCILINHILIYH